MLKDITFTNLKDITFTNYVGITPEGGHSRRGISRIYSGDRDGCELHTPHSPPQCSPGHVRIGFDVECRPLSKSNRLLCDGTLLWRAHVILGHIRTHLAPLNRTSLNRRGDNEGVLRKSQQLIHLPLGSGYETAFDSSPLVL